MPRLFIDEDWGSTTEGVKQPTNGTGGGGAAGLRREGKDDLEMLPDGQIFGPLSQMWMKEKKVQLDIASGNRIPIRIDLEFWIRIRIES